VTERVEFGSKDVADSYREEYAEHLCTDDDKRLKTVAFSSDTPEHVLEQARLDAADGRGEREGGAGQVPLSDHEKEQIDFSEARASVPHAQAVKGLAASEGVDDWLAHYDPTLTVDEHRDLAERAKREGGGRRLDQQESVDDRLGRAEAAVSQECDHARDHCEHGDPDACEFLRDACGYDDEDIETILDGEQATEEEISGEAAGALGRAWQGYKAAIARLGREIEDALEAKEHAEQAAAAINAIRADHGQDPIELERLEELSDRLAVEGETAHDAQGHVEQQAT
jgi:hypothetical protein